MDKVEVYKMHYPQNYKRHVPIVVHLIKIQDEHFMMQNRSDNTAV